MRRRYAILRLISHSALRYSRGDLFGMEIEIAVKNLRETLDKDRAEPRSVKIIVEADVLDPVQGRIKEVGPPWAPL